MATQKRYSADFKAKVALEAIREELTTAELSKSEPVNATGSNEQANDIHPTMINGRKRHAIANMAQAFDTKGALAPDISGKEVEKLHAKIGQLVVERDAPQGLRGPTGATVPAAMQDASAIILGSGSKKR